LDYLAAYLEIAAAKVVTDRRKHGWKQIGKFLSRIITPIKSFQNADCQ